MRSILLSHSAHAVIRGCPPARRALTYSWTWPGAPTPIRYATLRIAD